MKFNRKNLLFEQAPPKTIEEIEQELQAEAEERERQKKASQSQPPNQPESESKPLISPERLKQVEDEYMKYSTSTKEKEPDIFSLFSQEHIDKVIADINKTDNPAEFRLQQQRNVESVIGSIIGYSITQDISGGAMDTIFSTLPDTVKIGNLRLSKDEIKGFLKTKAATPGGMLAGSAIYRGLFGTGLIGNEYIGLQTPENKNEFGVAKAISRAKEQERQYSMKPGELPKTALEKLSKVTQPFASSVKPESQGPADYYSQPDLKNRVPEGFGFMQDYDRFFGGAPTSKPNLTGGVNAPAKPAK